jgi:hypothetical protein
LSKRSFKRGTIVEYNDGSIYILCKQAVNGAWEADTVVECIEALRGKKFLLLEEEMTILGEVDITEMSDAPESQIPPQFPDVFPV